MLATSLMLAGPTAVAAISGVTQGIVLLRKRRSRTEQKTLEVTEKLLDRLSDEHMNGRSYAELTPKHKAFIDGKAKQERLMALYGYGPPSREPSQKTPETQSGG